MTRESNGWQNHPKEINAHLWVRLNNVHKIYRTCLQCSFHLPVSKVNILISFLQFCLPNLDPASLSMSLFALGISFIQVCLHSPRFLLLGEFHIITLFGRLWSSIRNFINECIITPALGYDALFRNQCSRAQILHKIGKSAE